MTVKCLIPRLWVLLLMDGTGYEWYAKRLESYHSMDGITMQRRDDESRQLSTPSIDACVLHQASGRRRAIFIKASSHPTTSLTSQRRGNRPGRLVTVARW